jgi:hypothetical protein
MKPGNAIGFCLATTVLLTGFGCQQPDEKIAMDTTRPAELDYLDVWTGHWRVSTEVQLADGETPRTATFDDSYRWVCNRHALINEWTGKTPDGDEEGIGLWTWDPEKKRYRIWQVDSQGTMVTGTVARDANGKTWNFEGTAQNTITGKLRTFEATANMTSDNTIRYVGKSWHDAWKLNPRSEFTGTARRK